ncbi:MAG: hypothetical protein VKL39_12970 [Leptolyngbyaceae bacterium]|nr:hypothetical protein [Leptolyngbyaceae bacterium]
MTLLRHFTVPKIRDSKPLELIPYDRSLALLRPADLLALARDPDKVQLSALRREDEGSLAAALARLIEFWLSTQGKEMPAIAILSLTTELMTKFWYMTFEETAFVLRRGFMGEFRRAEEYTVQYSVPVVLGWFRAYDLERGQAICEAAHREHAQRKEEKTPLPAEGLSQDELLDLYLRSYPVPYLHQLHQQGHIDQKTLDHYLALRTQAPQSPGERPRKPAPKKARLSDLAPEDPDPDFIARREAQMQLMQQLLQNPEADTKSTEEGQ